MASSRLERIGTIFSRVKGLLRSGAMKPEDKPIWYDVYAAFPPKYEPRYDRPAPDIPIRQILYPEDEIRARYHKASRPLQAVNLTDHETPSQTQKFLQTYSQLQEEGKVPAEQLFAASLDLSKVSRPTPESHSEDTLADSFKKAQSEKKNVDLKDIFRE